MLRRRLIQRKAYIACFEGLNGKIVLEDLARWCHVRTTTHTEGDPCGTALLEGRRQVFLRIQEFLHLSEEQIEQALSQAAVMFEEDE